jgi:hypothetical protein
MKTEKSENLEELTEVTEPVDTEEIVIPLTLDDKINNFIERANVENLTPCMYVYKYKQNSSTQRSLCGKFEGEDIPDEHNIGLQYGSGRYLAIVQVPSGEKQARKQSTIGFEISPNYDDLRRTAAVTGQLPYLNSLPVRNASMVPQNAQADNMTMLRETMSFMAELFGKMQGAAPAPLQQNTDIAGLMLQQYKGMGDVLKANLLQTDSMMQEALKSKLMAEMKHLTGSMNNNEPEPDESEPPNIIQALLPELIKILPAILSSPKTAALMQAATSPAAIQAAETTISNLQQSHKKAADTAILKKVMAKNKIIEMRKKKKSSVASTIPAPEGIKNV